MKPSHPSRILTCCYCGARSILPVRASGALVCHGCGAPIRKIERLQPAIERAARGQGPKSATPHPATRRNEHLDKDRPARRRKGKRRQRSVFQRFRSLVDDADDLFDFEDWFDFD